MEKELFNFKMASMKASLRREKSTVVVFIIGKMEKNLKVNLGLVEGMEKECWLIQIILNSMVFG